MADVNGGDGGGGAQGGLAMFRQKIGGVPVWMYLVGLGVGGIGIVYLMNRNKVPAPGSAAATGQDTGPGLSGTSAGDASSMFPIAPVTYVTGVQSPTPTPQADDNTSGNAGSMSINAVNNIGNVAVLAKPAGSGTNWQSQMVGQIANGQSITPTGPPVSGPSFSYAGVTSSQWQPISWAGGTGYVWAPNVTGGLGGLGGGADQRVAGDGGVPRGSPWQEFTQQYRVPHFWGGMGGGGKGSIGGASRASGVDTYRLAHLNPFHSGDSMVRVA